ATHWPWLPTELYAYVLRFLPPDDDAADTSVKALVHCLGANSQLRAAAKQSSIWKPHYRARYTECVEEREAERRAKAKGDYRRMYIARRELDRRALEAVDEIRLQLSGRHAKAAAFVKEFSFDVWNALEREARLPLPAYLWSVDEGGYLEEDIDMDVEEVPHALPRRYWAKAIMGEDDQLVTFEEALAGLSAFYDQSPKHISTWLGMLVHDCRVQLTAAGAELDPASPDYDLPMLVVLLRDTLRGMGFRIAEGDDFYNPLNQFPHAIMRPESRKTIPMGLVYVYTSVARRLGIRASPTNYPGKVLCHIDPIDPEQNEMLFDVCGHRDLRQMLVDIGLRPDMPAEIIRPCKVGTILHRAAANTIIAVRWNHGLRCFCISLLQSQDNQILSQIMDSKPLDAWRAQRAGADILAKHCEKLVETDEELRDCRPVMYFVGLIVQHKKYEYAGCIIGWHDLSPVMEVQRLARGWDQPFYWVITVDGSKRSGQTGRRGRLLPTQELQTLYPEDDQVGSSWVCRGTLGNRKLSFDAPSTH
ncbi:uncharacterized protein B0H18DRAFT_969901, partial [Fomitopsis serialis]|uniref:uncharacterized protein n=1 Tax=Fomitopsis serialis TaxID=139415 RepID=UPI0020081DF4